MAGMDWSGMESLAEDARFKRHADALFARTAKPKPNTARRAEEKPVVIKEMNGVFVVRVE